MRLSDDVYQTVGSTWKISLKRLFVLLFQSLKKRADIDESLLYEMMQLDFQRSGEKSSFELLIKGNNKVTKIGTANKRQQQMLR